MSTPTLTHELIKFGGVSLLALGLLACAQTPQRTDQSSSSPPPPANSSAKPSDGMVAERYSVTISPTNLWEKLGENFGLSPLTGPGQASTGYAVLGRADYTIWDRMRAGFALPGRHEQRVQREAQDFADDQERLSETLTRAEPYLYFVLEEIEKRRMPTEIALLPLIESAYQPMAQSDQGAAGMWQFIPSTGRNFGLKQTFWYDGRRDVIASTNAALDYLQKLNTDFEGDWLLTLAAYNAGEGAVQRAVKKNQRASKPTDFWSLDLPGETKAYIPRLLGIAALASAPDEFNVTLKPISNAPYVASVDLDSPINLTLAAKMADISQKEMRQLNPGFLRGATAPHGPHQLLLPVDKVAAFTAKLAALSVDKRLAVPGGSGIKDRKPVLSKAEGKDPGGTAKQSPPSKSLIAASSSTQSSKPLVQYTVREGDSWERIAKHFRITTAQLRTWNADKVEFKYLMPGHSLTVYPNNGSVANASMGTEGLRQ
ncbi:MAG TPA: transglycosylase SLT domain-containing protein [Gammaproteobacteria bacterium]|nr:transglycosylase SLT domain-containing protein [Gammaproteobacteria bacterium]